MSNVKAKNFQVGADGTASNNFTWYQPAVPDGTVRLGKGNAGGTTQDVIKINADGGVNTVAPAFSAYITSNQNLSSTTLTKVTFNNEEFDTASCFDAATNYRFTPNVAGYYQIDLTIVGIASGSGSLYLTYLYKNGAAIRTVDNRPSSNVVTNSLSSVIYMNGTTDYLEVYHRIDGTTPFIQGASNSTNFSGSLVRAA